MSGLRNHWIACSKCDFKQKYRQSCPDTGPFFRYQVSDSDTWYPIIVAYAWCPKCKLVRETESLDISPIEKHLTQLLLEYETYQLKHPGIIAKVKEKLHLSHGSNLQHEISKTIEILSLLKKRTDRKCLRCGFTAPSIIFESGSSHPSCSGGILTELVEETGIQMDFDNSCRKVRWYSVEGMFLREDSRCY
jgi:hypothetical protein